MKQRHYTKPCSACGQDIYIYHERYTIKGKGVFTKYFHAPKCPPKPLGIPYG